MLVAPGWCHDKMRGYDVYKPQKRQKSWWMAVNSNRDDRLSQARDWEAKYEFDRLVRDLHDTENE